MYPDRIITCCISSNQDKCWLNYRLSHLDYYFDHHFPTFLRNYVLLRRTSNDLILLSKIKNMILKKTDCYVKKNVFLIALERQVAGRTFCVYELWSVQNIFLFVLKTISDFIHAVVFRVKALHNSIFKITLIYLKTDNTF